MKATAGTGALLCGRSVVQVAYDLVQCAGHSRNTAEGQVFGDADAIRLAYQSGLCGLRLEGGQVTSVVLLNCHYNGAADVAVKGSMLWD